MYGWMNGANSDIADFNPEDGYSEHDLENFQIFTLYYRISISNQVLSATLSAKITIKKNYLWYIWTGKDQNFALRTIFGHFIANWES